MAEVVVTRADREAAVALLYGDDWGRSTAAAPARFAGTGLNGDRERHVSLERAALAIAKARAEGFAAGREAERRACIADVDDHLAGRFNYWKQPLHSLRACLTGERTRANGEHVGTADKETP